MGYNTPMNGSQIAEQLGISRQSVSYSIRRSMKKLYKKVISMGLADRPFDAVLVLMDVLNVGNKDESDIKNFLKLFDKKTIDSVMEDARKSYNIR